MIVFQKRRYQFRESFFCVKVYLIFYVYTVCSAQTLVSTYRNPEGFLMYCNSENLGNVFTIKYLLPVLLKYK